MRPFVHNQKWQFDHQKEAFNEKKYIICYLIRKKLLTSFASKGKPQLEILRTNFNGFQKYIQVRISFKRGIFFIDKIIIRDEIVWANRSMITVIIFHSVLLGSNISFGSFMLFLIYIQIVRKHSTSIGFLCQPYLCTAQLYSSCYQVSLFSNQHLLIYRKKGLANISYSCQISCLYFDSYVISRLYFGNLQQVKFSL